MEVTDAVMPRRGERSTRLGPRRPGHAPAVASAHPGVNSNVLADEAVIEPVSGNAVLNGIPIEVSAA